MSRLKLVFFFVLLNFIRLMVSFFVHQKSYVAEVSMSFFGLTYLSLFIGTAFVKDTIWKNLKTA